MKNGGLRTRNIIKNILPNKPLITIVTVVLNGEKFIEECIKSVVTQNYKNFEYLVIDGGSVDGTVDILKKYDSIIDYWVSEKDTGIYNAWNKSIQLSRGEWIGFVGVDDEYLPGALLAYSDEISNLPTCNYVSSRVNILSGSRVKVYGSPYSENAIKYGMIMAHVGSLHKTSWLREKGMFSEEYKIIGDYEFFIRNRSSVCPRFLDRITATMRSGGVSDSVGVFKELYMLKRAHNFSHRYLLLARLFFDSILYLIRKSFNR